MAKPFFERLASYFEDVGAAMRGDADAASIFPNASDKGAAREDIYAAFLVKHAPSKCNVTLGGFLFGADGSESKQLDILVTSDISPRYQIKSVGSEGKSFSQVEGTVGVISVKSKLDKKELFDALLGIASIPPVDREIMKLNPMLKYPNFGKGPFKVVYASSGISLASIKSHVIDFYDEYPDISLDHRPDVIHVAGKYAIVKANPELDLDDIQNIAGKKANAGDFVATDKKPDVQAIMWVLDGLQTRAAATGHMVIDFGSLINQVAKEL